MTSKSASSVTGTATSTFATGPAPATKSGGGNYVRKEYGLGMFGVALGLIW